MMIIDSRANSLTIKTLKVKTTTKNFWKVVMMMTSTKSFKLKRGKAIKVINLKLMHLETVLLESSLQI
jgi:hypothetical protein